MIGCDVVFAVTIIEKAEGSVSIIVTQTVSLRYVARRLGNVLVWKFLSTPLRFFACLRLKSLPKLNRKER